MLNVGRRTVQRARLFNSYCPSGGQATYAETLPSLAMADTPVALYGAAIRLTSQR
jgi:hypothetical protein